MRPLRVMPLTLSSSFFEARLEVELSLAGGDDGQQGEEKRQRRCMMKGRNRLFNAMASTKLQGRCVELGSGSMSFEERCYSCDHSARSGKGYVCFW